MRQRILPILLSLPMIFGGTMTAHTQLKAIAENRHSSARGWLGVQIQNLNSDLAKKLNAPSEDGALIARVIEKSPAEKAGLKKDDIITDFNGHSIYEVDDLMEAVRRTKPETKVSLAILRDGQKKSVPVTLGKEPRDRRTFHIPAIPPLPHFMMSASAFGLRLSNLNPQLGEYFGVSGGKGALVEEVEKESEADSAGFKAGDVITHAGSEAVEDVGDVLDALGELASGDTCTIQILRRGASKTLSLIAPEEESSHGLWMGRPGHRFYMERFPGRYWEQSLRHYFDQLRLQSGGLKERLEELKENLKSAGNSL
jgi:S1-C subfamily serine protease